MKYSFSVYGMCFCVCQSRQTLFPIKQQVFCLGLLVFGFLKQATPTSMFTSIYSSYSHNYSLLTALQLGLSDINPYVLKLNAWGTQIKKRI